MVLMLPETRNVVQMGFSFCLLILAFNAQSSIEESVISSVGGSIDSHAGYNSLAVLYFALTFANFVAAPIVDVVGAKWAMVLGGLCFVVFQVGFLFINSTYLYASSALVGFGAAILFTGQGSYLSQNCNERTSGRNSAIVWSMMQGSGLFGGALLLATFSITATTDSITKDTVVFLYSVFTGLTVLSVIISALLPAAPSQILASSERLSYGNLIVSIFKLMTTRKMALLAFVFAYTGIETSFWLGIYPTCISFTKGLGGKTTQLLSLNTVCVACGQCCASILLSMFSSRIAKVGKSSVIFAGTVANMTIFALAFLNFPASANLDKSDDTGLIGPFVWIVLLGGFLLGFGDACWNTQIYAFLVEYYPHYSSQAFAIFKFYQGAASCSAFFYSSAINLRYNLLILVVTLLIAVVCFFMVEKLAKYEKSERCFEVEKQRVVSVSSSTVSMYKKSISSENE